MPKETLPDQADIMAELSTLRTAATERDNALTEVANLQAQVTRLTAQENSTMTEAFREIERRDASITALTGERDAARTQVAALNTQITSLNGQVTTLTASQKDFDDKLCRQTTSSLVMLGIRKEAVALPTAHAMPQGSETETVDQRCVRLVAERKAREAQERQQP